MIVSAQPSRPSAYSCKRDGLWDELMADLATVETLEDLTGLRARIAEREGAMPWAWFEAFNDCCDAVALDLRNAELDAAFRGAVE